MRKIRLLAAAVALLLIGLAIFAHVRKKRVRESSLPLGNALIDYFDVHTEVYDGLAHAISNGSCPAAEAEANGLLERLTPRAAEIAMRLLPLKNEASRAQLEAAGEAFLARRGQALDQLAARRQQIFDRLREFRARCPAEAQAIDARFMHFMGSGLVE